MSDFAKDTNVPINDCISRQAAIDAMQDLPYGYRGMVRDIIYNLPSAQRWILVTERLPEDNYWVNVFVLDESGDGRFMYASVGWYLSDGTWIVDNEPMYDDGSIRVIAWMPLPAPWKGGES